MGDITELKGSAEVSCLCAAITHYDLSYSDKRHQ